MKLTEFLDSKAIPFEDVEKNFKLLRTFVTHADSDKCLHCGNKHRHIVLLCKGSWRSMRVCYECETIALVYYGDLQGAEGNPCDTVEIYGEK
jgi:hypothetical protein